MAMEFWGEEVKPGTKVSCKVAEGYVIHLSQAALGETKKGNENVVVSVKVDEKKLVLGTLSIEKHPQIMCDIIFDKDFELSHSSKTNSVFLCGYKSEMPSEFESGSDEDEELKTDEIPIKNIELKQSVAKVLENDGKKDKHDDDGETSSGDDDFSDDSDDSEMSEDESSDEDELSSGDDDLSDDSDDESDDSEEQTPTPKKPEVVGKKRAIEAAVATPSGKKPKTPTGDKSGQQTGDKKASKTPVDKSAKTPTADKKSKEKSPKSGSHPCKSCNKTFNSESALGSHQKAMKHEA